MKIQYVGNACPHDKQNPAEKFIRAAPHFEQTAADEPKIDRGVDSLCTL